MHFFILIIVLLTILAIKYEITEKESIIDKIIIFIIIFLCAFKYQMGRDWYMYQDFYENVIPKVTIYNILEISTFSKYRFEIGYSLLNLISYKLGFSYEAFQGIIMSILIYRIFSFLKKQSENQYLSFIFLFMTVFFTYFFDPIIRQLIAITIFLNSIKYMEEKKTIKFFLYIILAAQFHKSAYILLPFYFISYFNFNYGKIIFVTFVLSLLLSNINILIEKIPFFSVYSVYFSGNAKLVYILATKRSIKFEIIKLIILSLKLYIIKNNYRSSNKYNYSIEISSIFFCIIVYLADKLPIIRRFEAYFYIQYAIVLISCFKNFKFFSKYKIKIFNYTLVILYLSYLTLNWYKFFFLDEKVNYRFIYKNYIFKLINGDFNSREEKKKEIEDYYKKLVEIDYEIDKEKEAKIIK